MTGNINDILFEIFSSFSLYFCVQFSVSIIFFFLASIYLTFIRMFCARTHITRMHHCDYIVQTENSILWHDFFVFCFFFISHVICIDLIKHIECEFQKTKLWQNDKVFLLFSLFIKQYAPGHVCTIQINKFNANEKIPFFFPSLLYENEKIILLKMKKYFFHETQNNFVLFLFLHWLVWFF